MTDTYCAKSDLPVDRCAHCRGVGAKEEAPRRWFRAKFAGRCYGCGEEFEVKSLVRYEDDSIVCTGCG
jgi:hypothetical protein